MSAISSSASVLPGTLAQVMAEVRAEKMGGNGMSAIFSSASVLPGTLAQVIAEVRAEKMGVMV